MQEPMHRFDDGTPGPDLSTDIAVVGMSGRFPGAPDIGTFWQNLKNGVEAITSLSDEQLLAAGVSPKLLKDRNYVKRAAPLPDMEMFDAGFFGLSPREASIMDPQHRHFLECAWEALEDGGHVPDQFGGSIAVFAGSGHNAYMPYNLLTNPKLMQSVGFFLVRHTGNDKDFLTTRASYLLDLKGPSVNVQTACSTSLVAIHMAVQSLLHDECDMALAGGVTIELPHRQGYLYEDGQILSPDGHCRAFDAESQGTVFGSAVGVVALRRLDDAVADGDHVYAVIKGSAINNDGSGKVGYLAPSVDGQAQAIAEALAIAQVPAETITYVEAHGTGTPVGDPIEVAALTQAYRQDTNKVGYCGIGSIKTNIGHTDTAAGVASFIKVALAMKHGELPPTLHYKSPNPACEFETSPFHVNAALKPWTPPHGLPRRAGISSLGVGGTNAHVILEEAPARPASGPSRTQQLLVLSAKTASALDANTAALAAHLAADPLANLADIAYTLQVGRQPMPHRRSVVVSSNADAAAAFGSMDPKRVFSHAGTQVPRDVAFMFAGGGAQYPNMGLDLYHSEPVFQSAVDLCLELLAQHAGSDIRRFLFPSPGHVATAAAELERPSIGLPALFAIQYAQAMLWMSWGIRPTAMIGHSMGEYMAAHLAGVFSLADTLKLVQLRGQLFERVAEGAMLSVPLGVEELKALMPTDLSVAAINGPRLTVASGPVESIEALQSLLAEREVEAARVRISVAAHSAMLDPILDEFRCFLRQVTKSAPTLPFVSTLSGTWITAVEAIDADYWVRHLRNTVRFGEGLQELLSDEGLILLEVGPGRTLSSLARQHPARASRPVFNSLRHPDEQVSDTTFALDTLGRLWASGAAPDWQRFKGAERRLRVPLPTYRFDHERFWIEPRSIASDPSEDDLLEKRSDIDDWFYTPAWHRRARPNAAVEAESTLIFEDGNGLATRLCERLRSEGHDVVMVRAGQRFARRGASSFTVDPAAPAGYNALIEALSAENRSPQLIYHLWSVTGDWRPVDTLKAADTMQQLGFYSLLYLAQALGQSGADAPTELVVVTDRLQRVTTETGLIPAKATLLGPCRVIPREYPHIRARCIDVQLASPRWRHEHDLVEALLAEASPENGDEVVAYRAGERWVQDWEPTRLTPAAGKEPVLREGGVYLITGGLGGIALSLARHLALTRQARLVLVGRTELPARAEWQDWLTDHDTHDPISQRIRDILALEALGGQVLVVSADVTNPRHMQSVVHQTRACFGGIDGVFHTAGVLDDGVIQLKDDRAAAAVLAPKVRGTLVLEAALRDERPDFVLLFSSISAFAGLAGQVDYAAANAFLEAYAQSQSAESDVPIIAIDWSQWQEVGMAAKLARELGLECDQLDGASSVPVGHAFVDQCLRDTPDERLYLTRFSPRTHWLLDEHRVAGGDALIPGTGFLEIVRAALAQQPEAGALQLHNVMFLAPFAVRDERERDLRVHLKRATPGAWSFVISGRAVGDGPATWVEHVRGGASYSNLVADACLDVSGIRRRCSIRRLERVDVEAPCHLVFGPRWRNINGIEFGEREALIDLELPDGFAGDLETIALHPALLDMATAGAQALALGFDQPTALFVPASYGEIRLHAPLARRLVSHVRYRSDAGDEDLAVYDITVADPMGHVLVEVIDFTMMRVRDSSRLADTMGEERSNAIRSSAMANHVLGLGQDIGILPEEGMQAIERVLGGISGPQVIVSPQDLKTFMAQLRRPPRRGVPATESGGDGDQAWKAPASPTAQLIAELWSEMLGVERVSATDNFFDLGGHSLLAVQFINRIRKRTGKVLPLTALLEAPTVEQLAALIDPSTADGASAADPTPSAAESVPARTPPADRAVVRIRSGDNSKPPLFFVHDGLGETLLYRTLALKLDAGHVIYGLQPDVRADGSIVHTRIDEMAAAHVARIRAVQPTGPYLLAGLCAGGVIAFEIARQLEDLGETTRFVGIIDAADVAAEERPLFVSRSRLNRFLAVLRDPRADGGPARMTGIVSQLAQKVVNAATYEVRSRIDQVRTAREVAKLRRLGEQSDGRPAAPVPAELSFLKVYEVAHRHHRPTGIFDGQVVLFKATTGDGTIEDAPFRNRYLADDMGWGARVAGRVQIMDVPGGHSSALQEPNVGVLAEQMQQCIDAALMRPAARIASPGHASDAPAAERVLDAAA